MTEHNEPLLQLEAALAMVLRQGTRIATLLVAAGLAAAWLMSAGHPKSIPGSMSIVNAGLFLFILLPTLRVGLMIVAFLKRRDYRFALIAACVLAIIMLGFAVALMQQSA